MYQYVFFIDIFFATKTGQKSSRVDYIALLFVTGKGFVCVIPMKKELEFSKAIRIFVKMVGSPEEIICDSTTAQKSK